MKARETDFLELIKQHERLIYKISFNYCRDAKDREDLVQEIIFQLWNNIYITKHEPINVMGPAVHCYIAFLLQLLSIGLLGSKLCIALVTKEAQCPTFASSQWLTQCAIERSLLQRETWSKWLIIT